MRNSRTSRALPSARGQKRASRVQPVQVTTDVLKRVAARRSEALDLASNRVSVAMSRCPTCRSTRPTFISPPRTLTNEYDLHIMFVPDRRTEHTGNVMSLVGKVIEARAGVSGDELCIGKRLRALRELAGLTQADLAKRLRIGQGALSRLESRGDIHVSTVKHYVEALGARLQINAVLSAETVLALRVMEAFDAELVDDNQLLLPIFDDGEFRPHRDVVLSIKPQYSSKILQGAKTVELRRRFPTNVPAGTLAFIYSTTPEKALVGCAEIASVTKSTVSDIWRAHRKAACIDKRDFETYFDGQAFGFALRFRTAWPFKHSIELSELRERFAFEPPQSFLYAKPLLREALRHELTELSN